MKMKDGTTGDPVFTCLQIELSCQKCKDDGKSHECQHLLHLVPRWQSSDKHRRLKKVMEDRPDLIQSELAGLAFDSLQQAFAAADIDRMFAQQPPDEKFGQPLFIVIDPAAGGPQSDYAIVSFTRDRGIITALPPALPMRSCIRSGGPPRGRGGCAPRSRATLGWRGGARRCRNPRRGPPRGRGGGS